MSGLELGRYRKSTQKLKFAARVAELVDALDLGSSGVTRESSSLSSRTNFPGLGDARVGAYYKPN